MRRKREINRETLIRYYMVKNIIYSVALRRKAFCVRTATVDVAVIH